jgi:hypothetical protein
MNERVRITVNGRLATYFLGLSVRHAIGARAAQAVQHGQAQVCDAYGNSVGLDGALYDGQTLIVRRLAPAGGDVPQA